MEFPSFWKGVPRESKCFPFGVDLFLSPPKAKGDMVMVSVHPSVHLSHFCLKHNSKTIQGILLKLHRVIKDIERKCSVQEP